MQNHAAEAASTPLKTLTEVTEYLQNSPQSYFYVSRSATNLLGLDRTIPGFHYITLIDHWDGTHPRSFTPTNIPDINPRGNITVVNWLLRNPQVQKYIADNTPAGYTPKIVLAMFDEESEAICRSLGYDLIMPPIKLRNHIDSKITTTELGNAAGFYSAPNILTEVSGWEDLRAQADEANLGERLVIQLPYGDSGRTTFFVESQSDFAKIAKEITGQPIKVMKNIRHIPLAFECVITESGTVVGPVLHEVTGHPEISSSKGAWGGSELYPGLITDTLRQEIQELSEKFCAQVAGKGYRGIIEVSVLFDTETGNFYLGEINPRISGSSAHSNLTMHGEILPLFAYHLLQFSGATLDLDINEINDSRQQLADTTWSSLILQHKGQRTERVISAPRTGRYRVSDNGKKLEFIAPDLDWQELENPNEVFWLRVSGPNHVREAGADVGVLITRKRTQEADKWSLTQETKNLVQAILQAYEAKPISTLERYWRAGIRTLRVLLKKA